MSYLIGSACSHCKTMCRRDRELKDGERFLKTPVILGKERILCHVCAAKVQANLDDLYYSLIKEDTRDQLSYL